MSVARRAGLIAAVLGLLGACSSNAGSGPTLDSACVRSEMALERSLPEGAECAAFSYSDCGLEQFASDCVHACAFDMCQAAPCSDDSACVDEFGADYECQPYVISSVDYGRWCTRLECTRGAPGCKCRLDGTCAEPDQYWAVSCTAAGLCEGEDTCPSGCRAGSVCCGGAFCSGDCIGAPCC
jgi:hypothetical protein